MVIVGVAFLALGLGGYSRESLGHHAVRREGLGHSTSLAVVAGPFAKLYRKPQAAFIVAVLFSNIFQLVGESASPIRLPSEASSDQRPF